MDLKRRILVEIDGTGAQTGAQKVNDSLQSIERQSKQMSAGGARAFDDLRGSVTGLSRYLPLLASGFAALKLGELVKDSALLAARYDTLGVVMNTVGMNAGYTAGRMAAFEAGLQKTGISMIEVRNNLARMAQAHLDLAKASELARIAQDAAVIGNINSSQAFERLVYGIQSGQTEILRTIGINVNFEASYKKLAAEVGKNAKQLTESEKAQARMNSVMESGTKIAGTYAGAMETAGKQISSLDRLSENAKVKLGDLFQPALTTGVKLYTEALKEANEQLDRMVRLKNASGEATTSGELARRVLAAQQTVEEQRRFQADNAKPGTAKWDQYQKLIDQAQGAVERLRGEMSLLGEQERNTARLQGYRAEQNKKGLAKEEEAAAALLSTTTKQTEAERMLLSVREDIAKLTLSDKDFEKFQLSAEYENLAKELGAANPQLQQWLKLKERDLELTQMARLEPYQVTQFEKMNRGDMFYGLTDANKRAQDMLDEVYQKNDELQTEFSAKYIASVQGESAAKIAELDRLAELYVKNGSDEIAVAQWVAQEKLKVSREWSDGVKRGLQDYADSATNAAALAEDAITSGFDNMTDALVDFAMEGKGSFSDFADSVIRDMVRIGAQQAITGPLASGAADLVKYLIGGGSSASVSSGKDFWISPSAKGNVFNAPGLHAYANSIVDRPTVFPFARGVGLMGEDGPEAIMPLKRGPDGSLGVAGGGSNVTVNVIESPGGGGRQEQRTGPGGERIIDVFVEQVKASIAADITNGRGLIPAAGQKTFGWNRANGALR